MKLQFKDITVAAPLYMAGYTFKAGTVGGTARVDSSVVKCEIYFDTELRLYYILYNNDFKVLPESSIIYGTPYDRSIFGEFPNKKTIKEAPPIILPHQGSESVVESAEATTKRIPSHAHKEKAQFNKAQVSSPTMDVFAGEGKGKKGLYNGQ